MTGAKTDSAQRQSLADIQYRLEIPHFRVIYQLAKSYWIVALTTIP